MDRSSLGHGRTGPAHQACGGTPLTPRPPRQNEDRSDTDSLDTTAPPAVLPSRGAVRRGDHSSRRDNKILKRALFLSAFAALEDPLSRAYYDRKHGQDKRHNQALIALARRRCDVLYAMLRDGTLYDAKMGAAA
jgi:hypothetical protein